MRLAVITTHPIQYQAPWFRELSQHPEVQLKVYFSSLPDASQQGQGFGVPFQWDIPLTSGYEWEVLEGSPVHSFGVSKYIRLFRHITSALKRDKPDCVLLTGWHTPYMWLALFASIWLRIPRMVRGESNALRPRAWWIRLGHRLLLGRFAACLAIGRSSREFYLQNGVGPDRIFLAPYFIDNDRFVAQSERFQEERNLIRTRWDIPAQSICFLYAGKLIPKKRIFDLLKALRIVCEGTKEIHLLVVGTGELYQAAKQYAQGHQLPVSFAGFLNQSEIAAAYVAGDCLVLPSDYGETWGLVVNEAMACGLPAIVSDRVGCGPDLVENEVTGYTYPFSNIAELADRMLRCVRDRTSLVTMGQQAQELVLRDYSLEKAVKGTLAALNSRMR